MTTAPIRVGIIGMGGFAQQHHRAIQALQARNECKLVAACDPYPETFEDARLGWDLDGRGARVFTDYREMLDACAGDMDVVTVPTPVPLHAEMHRAIVGHNVACYLEKPPTLDPEEFDAMMAVERHARFVTQVGFNFIVEIPRRELKHRLLTGEFGAVRRVCFTGIWPRAASYYTRNNWAGRLSLEHRLVLDSPIGNAMAHYVHNALFWAGPSDIDSWATVAHVRAELYRAHAIQGADTVFLQATTTTGASIDITATHACSGQSVNPEIVECEDATITYVPGQPYNIRWRDGRSGDFSGDRRDLLIENLRAYFHYLQGRLLRPPTRLTDCRSFVDLNALAYIAAGRITTVGNSYVERFSSGQEDHFVAIRGLREACETFCKTRALPAQSGLAWAGAGGEASSDRLSELRTVVRGMERPAGPP